MRFMVMMKATADSEAGTPPKTEDMAAAIAFNEELVEAGILLAADGLKPSSAGVRVRFTGDRRTVIDGPFAETEELVAGYWITEVGSKEEAVEWFLRCPNTRGEGAELEIRPFLGPEDFGDDVLTPEQREAVARMEATGAEQHGWSGCTDGRRCGCLRGVTSAARPPRRRGGLADRGGPHDRRPGPARPLRRTGPFDFVAGTGFEPVRRSGSTRVVGPLRPTLPDRHTRGPGPHRERATSPGTDRHCPRGRSGPPAPRRRRQLNARSGPSSGGAARRARRGTPRDGPGPSR